MFSIDTDVLVRAAKRRAGTRHRAALTLSRAAAGSEAGLTSESVIEFVNVARCKQDQSVAAAAKLTRAWLDVFPLLLPSDTIVEDTLHLLGDYRLSVWDAHMLAACAANGCEALLSEDLADGGIQGAVKVLNRFLPHNRRAIAELLVP
jgi:predicted nucleic acid-binding protein